MTSTRVAPRREDVGALGAAAIPFILSFIAGMADVTSFVLLNGLFAAHITGNVVVLAADVATHQPLRLTADLPVVGVVAGTAALPAAAHNPPRAPYQWAKTFLLMAVGLLLCPPVARLARH